MENHIRKETAPFGEILMKRTFLLSKNLKPGEKETQSAAQLDTLKREREELAEKRKKQ